MLLDQKRTKRLVQVGAILTSIAFVGIFPIILFFIIFGGGTGGQNDLIGPAEELVAENPQDPEAWEELASAHAAGQNFEDAIEAERMAVELDPKNFNRVSTLVGFHIQTGDPDAAVEAVQTYTRANPKDADAFLTLGQLAANVGRFPLARLSYQRYLQLSPDSPDAPAVRQAIEQLDSGGGGPPAGAEPAPDGG